MSIGEARLTKRKLAAYCTTISCFLLSSTKRFPHRSEDKVAVTHRRVWDDDMGITTVRSKLISFPSQASRPDASLEHQSIKLLHRRFSTGDNFKTTQ